MVHYTLLAWNGRPALFSFLMARKALDLARYCKVALVLIGILVFSGTTGDELMVDKMKLRFMIKSAISGL